MKVLKTIEKILFLVSVVLGVAALGLSYLLDEGAKTPRTGVGTGMLTLFTLGCGFVLLILIVGAVLKFSKNETTGRVGEGLALTAIISLFSISLFLIISATKGASALSEPSSDVKLPISALLGLVSGILYILYAGVKCIIVVVGCVKPEVNSADPDNDATIQAVLKWKKLLDENIISKDEFEKKRVEILGLKEKSK